MTDHLLVVLLDYTKWSKKWHPGFNFAITSVNIQRFFHCENKKFMIHAPVTGKVRRPTVESLKAGTDRLSVVEERSLCQESSIKHVRSKTDETNDGYFVRVCQHPLNH